MLTLQQIRDALKDRNLAKVSEATGVGYAIVVRLANGSDTSYENGRTLALYLMEQAEAIKSATGDEAQRAYAGAAALLHTHNPHANR